MGRAKTDPEIQIPGKCSFGNTHIGDIVELYFLQKEEGYKGTNITRVVKRRFVVAGKYPAGLLLERNGSREFFRYWEFAKRLNPPEVLDDKKNGKMYRWEGSVL